MNYPQVYRLSMEEAKERGEDALFRASHKLNVACSKAVEASVRANFDGMHLKGECIKPVLGKYGFDRLEWVLANTIQQKRYDGRFSIHNKKWADGFHFPENGGNSDGPRWDFIVGSHPAVLDGFVDMVRAEKGREEKRAEKPSIKEQLAASPVPEKSGKGNAAKNKDMEVR